MQLYKGRVDKLEIWVEKYYLKIRCFLRREGNTVCNFSPDGHFKKMADWARVFSFLIVGMIAPY